MNWFILIWIICGLASYIYGLIKHGSDTCSSPFFFMYIVLMGPIGLFIQIAEEMT